MQKIPNDQEEISSQTPKALGSQSFNAFNCINRKQKIRSKKKEDLPNSKRIKVSSKDEVSIPQTIESSANAKNVNPFPCDFEKLQIVVFKHFWFEVNAVRFSNIRQSEYNWWKDKQNEIFGVGVKSDKKWIKEPKNMHSDEKTLQRPVKPIVKELKKEKAANKDKKAKEYCRKSVKDKYNLREKKTIRKRSDSQEGINADCKSDVLSSNSLDRSKDSELRLKSRKLLEDILKKQEGGDDIDIVNRVAKKVESKIYRNSKANKEKYSSKIQKCLNFIQNPK